MLAGEGGAGIAGLEVLPSMKSPTVLPALSTAEHEASTEPVISNTITRDMAPLITSVPCPRDKGPLQSRTVSYRGRSQVNSDRADCI